ncbi:MULTISPECIES: PrsW family intramembrane metalloprotease [Methanoculleus]|jgi:RsiW-degrading membrane proteinase PrsW (M82 family)|uniref:PrsW family intramembrane metalloprotease n=1 Tax=Methanoculleus TaxID=45989 RepID=UPI0022EE1912|nr:MULTISPECIES: PrsW family intramembrane metalloprotease [Methanoculleus]GLI46182.1 PrsW family intramembrane metalloprotease [Methanoculleus bourgensis]
MHTRSNPEEKTSSTIETRTLDVMVDVEPMVILALALGPGVFWAWYFYHRDKFEPEPAALVIKIFLLGVLVTFPVAFIEGLFGLFIVSQLVKGVIVAPVVEEYGKFWVVRRFAYRNVEFDEPMDGIVYAASAALGLASLENVLYVFAAYMTSPSLAIGTIIVRAIFSVPGHALFSSVWGYALGRARFMAAEQRKGVVLRGLVLAMVLHGIFNFLLFSTDVVAYAMLIFILVLTPGLWILADRNIRSALRWRGRR